jgi:hypothetical protein
MWEPRPLTPLWAFTDCYRNSFTFFMQQRCKHVYGLCFLRGPCRGVIKRTSNFNFNFDFDFDFELVEFLQGSLPGYELGSWEIRNESSSRVGSCSMELKEMAVKGGWEVMARKELGCAKKISCVLQWQWDCYKSVAMMQLMKTENPSAYVTVYCKVQGEVWK